MVDYIANYLENIRDRRVFPEVKPGYMSKILLESAPTEGENWEDIFKDVEDVIMPGVSNQKTMKVIRTYLLVLNVYFSK